MINAKILLVEDELVLAEIIQESLRSRGFDVVCAETLLAARGQYFSERPDLMVLDVMLPDGSGFDLAKQIRNIDTELPIIFLTSRSLPRDVVQGFESGGNDYLKKPFSLEELIVRIKALLSRNRLMIAAGGDVQTTAIGSYYFKYPIGELSATGYRKMLTTREAEILYRLILHKNHVLSRDELLMELWKNNDYFSGRSLDVFITKLRKYLSGDPSVNILNIRGQGYKLIY